MKAYLSKTRLLCLSPRLHHAHHRLFVIIFALCFAWNLSHAKDEFEKIGDVLTLAPVGVLIVSLGMQDYEGAWQLTAGSLMTQGTIEVIKKSFQLAHDKGASVSFAKRPCCDDYKGMPSGHAGGAFSAAGFVFYRYGWKPALPMIALGIITDASRVHARKHSVWQVLAGSLIAWGWAWVFTTPYKPRNLLVTPEVFSDASMGNGGMLNVSYRW